MRLVIASTWDGHPVDANEQVNVELLREAGALLVQIDAPFYNDPAPPGPAGSTPELWNFEVVELMLLGCDERYVELELGPHGHYLALQLRGRRNVESSGRALEFVAQTDAARFRGEARLPLDWLPRECSRVNAFAIHGVGEMRRYLAWRGAPGPKPDFHRLEMFGQLSL